MSEQLDLARAEALLRAHYAELDPGALRPETSAQIRAQLEAAAGHRGRAPTQLRLDPVRGASLTGRLGLGWSLAAAAVVALLVVSWIAVGRLAGPPVAGSPSALLSPGASAPVVASPGASAGSGVPSPSGDTDAPSATASASDQRAIAFADRNHGIVVGGYQGQGAVWATANEGQDWTSTIVPTAPLDSVTVLGSLAWASATCVGADPGCTPAVLESQDGGATWAVIAATSVGSLSFVDAQHGFGVDAGSQGSTHVLATTDGGRTWATAAGAAPCETGFAAAAVSFADANNGWVACEAESAVGNSSKEVVATSDGGASWTVRSRIRLAGNSPVGSLPLPGTFRSLDMLASGTGVAATWNEGLIRTTDGGATWTRLPLGAVGGSLQWPGAAITGDGGLFALTMDVTSNDTSATFNLGLTDGRDWKPYGEFARLPAPGTSPTLEPASPPQPALASSVAFFDATHGIATGGDANHAYLWRTADGGKSWSVSAHGGTSASIMAIHGDRAWMAVSTCPAGAQAGDSACTASIERSDDRGATWAVIGHATLTSMSFGNAKVGFGIGPLPHSASGDTTSGNGLGPYTTLDGGATWSPLANSRPCGSLDPVSVSFVSATQGWLGCEGMGGAGEASKGVMETIDGGRTWTWRSRVYGPSGSTNIGSISITDYLAFLSMDADGRGMWVGLRNSTFRTSDGGRTWVSCPPGEFDAFQTSGAAIVPGGPWFVVQSGSNIGTDPVGAARLMRSDDEGASWTQVGGFIPSPSAPAAP